jgi:hypothetical protein
LLLGPIKRARRQQSKKKSLKSVRAARKRQELSGEARDCSIASIAIGSQSEGKSDGESAKGVRKRRKRRQKE